ncbi:MAG: hypothetical protein ABR587_02235 [Candidatus Binatia bacterium]
MRSFRDVVWVLLGATVGMTICVAGAEQWAWSTTTDVVPLARLTVFAMLVGSIRRPAAPTPVTG